MFQKARLIHVVRKYSYNRLFSDRDFTVGLKTPPPPPPSLVPLSPSPHAVQSIVGHGFKYSSPPFLPVSRSCMAISYSQYIPVLFNLTILPFPWPSPFLSPSPHSGSNYLFSDSFVISPFNTILIRVIL